MLIGRLELAECGRFVSGKSQFLKCADFAAKTRCADFEAYPRPEYSIIKYFRISSLRLLFRCRNIVSSTFYFVKNFHSGFGLKGYFVFPSCFSGCWIKIGIRGQPWKVLWASRCFWAKTQSSSFQNGAKRVSIIIRTHVIRWLPEKNGAVQTHQALAEDLPPS